jgi:transcriptional regulator with XRE-family HTH domain
MARGKRGDGPLDKHIGRRIRMRRMMLDMSQAELATRIGLTFQQVQKYEKGTNRVSASRLRDLSRVLAVPLSFFFEDAPRLGEEPNVAGATVPLPSFLQDVAATKDGLAVMRAFAEIRDPNVRRRIADLIEAVAIRESSYR